MRVVTRIGAVGVALCAWALIHMWITPTRAFAAGSDGVVEINQPSSYERVLALSDVHGMFRNLQKLLVGAGVVDAAGNWAAGRALLIVVGDSIDKGPDSIEVLDTWMRLSDQAPAVGGRVLALLGNHEAEFLANPNDDDKASALYADLKRKGLSVTELTDLSRPRARFLRSLPVAARVGRWFFSHAGLYPRLSWADFTSKATAVLASGAYGDDFLAADDSVLEAKDWWDDDDARHALANRLASEGFIGVVFGHQPKALGVEGALAQTDGGHVIKIDNGMAPEAGAHAGHLLLFSHPGQMESTGQPEFYSLGADGKPQPVVKGKGK